VRVSDGNQAYLPGSCERKGSFQVALDYGPLTYYLLTALIILLVLSLVVYIDMWSNTPLEHMTMVNGEFPIIEPVTNSI